MKNFIIGIVLLVSSNYSRAQNDTIYEENYRVLADMLFSDLDSSIYGPNLLNRSFSTSEALLKQIRGDYSQIHTVVDYLEMYQALASSYLDSTKMMSNDSIAKFVENEFIANELSSEEDELIIPFGFLLHSMSYIDSTKADTLHFSFANNSLVPLVTESTLYKSVVVKSASVLEFYPDNGYETGTLKYTAGLVSHSPDISNLSLMLDVGRGFEPFNETDNLISFSRELDSTISRVAFTYERNDTTYNDTTTFYLVTDANNDLYKSLFTWDYDTQYSATNFDITYQYGVRIGCDNEGRKIRRPIILVPPYRPWLQNPSLKKYFKQFNVKALISSLADMGYDVIFVKQKPGNASLEKAGEFLAHFIKNINDQKIGDYPYEHWENIIIGYSMGGQVARYALKLLEYEHMYENKQHHHTRLYLPYDSPHLGANIPMFTQAVYRDMKVTNIMATLAYDALTDPASKDMAVNHILGSYIQENGNVDVGRNILITPAPTTERTNFVGYVTNSFNHQFTPLNDLRRSYPTFTRNVAVSTARNDQNYTQEFNLYPGRLLFDQPGVFGYGVGGFYNKVRQVYASQNSASHEIFRNKEQFLLFNLIPINTKNRHYRTINAQEWDMAQGGYKDEFFRGFGTGVTSILRSGAFGFGINEYQDGKHVSFLPLVSALGINPTIWSPNNLLYNVKEEGLMYNVFNFDPNQDKSDTYGYPNLANPTNHFNVTPFEAVYCDPLTYEHIKMQTSIEENGYADFWLLHIRDFILDEVEADIVYLQNKTIGLNHTQTELDFRYKAWYKAYDKIVIGKDVTPKTDIGPYVIQATGNITVFACNEVVLMPGFESQSGSKFHAFIGCNGCSRPRSAEVGDYIDLNEPNGSQNPREVVNTFAENKKVVEINVYPNPSNGEITIDLGEKVSNSNYQLFDILGNLVKSGNLEETKSTLMLDIEKGFFILRIVNNGKQINKKIQIL